MKQDKIETKKRNDRNNQTAIETTKTNEKEVAHYKQEELNQ